MSFEGPQFNSGEKEKSPEDFQKAFSGERIADIKTAIWIAMLTDHFGFDLEKGSKEEKNDFGEKFHSFWETYMSENPDIFQKYENDPESAIKDVKEAFDSYR